VDSTGARNSAQVATLIRNRHVSRHSLGVLLSVKRIIKKGLSIIGLAYSYCVAYQITLLYGGKEPFRLAMVGSPSFGPQPLHGTWVPASPHHALLSTLVLATATARSTLRATSARLILCVRRAARIGTVLRQAVSVVLRHGRQSYVCLAQIPGVLL
jgi:hypothetical protein